MSRRGRRGSFKKRFLIIKKRRAFISFYFNIYINRSFFHPRYFNKSFFSSSQVHFPCKYFSFCLFLCRCRCCCCFFFVVCFFWVNFPLRIIHRTPSHWMWRTGWTSQCQLALSYWKRWWWDWPRSTATPPSCEGWDRPLRGTSCRSVLLLGAGAWRRKRGERVGEGEEKKNRGWGVKKNERNGN